VAISHKHAYSLVMMRLTIICFGLYLSSCKPNQENGLPQDEQSKRISAKEHAQLIKEKLGIEKELTQLIDTKNADPNSEIEAAEKKLSQAYLNLQKKQSECSALLPLQTKIAQLQIQLRKERENQHEEQIKAINAEIIQTTDELKKCSEQQPEIQDAQAQIQNALANLSETRRKIANQIPEAKNLLRAIERLEGNLKEATQP